MPLCRLWLGRIPADGSRTDVLLPENITLLDYYGEPAQDTTVLHSEYTETSAAATGLYLLADRDFTVQLVYTARMVIH